MGRSLTAAIALYYDNNCINKQFIYYFKRIKMTTKNSASRNEKTSAKVATIASKVLSNPKSASAQKSLAGSALTQTANKKK